MIERNKFTIEKDGSEWTVEQFLLKSGKYSTYLIRNETAIFHTNTETLYLQHNLDELIGIARRFGKIDLNDECD